MDHTDIDMENMAISKKHTPPAAIKKAIASEASLEAIFTSQTRTYKDCRCWWLEDRERMRWAGSSSPVLAGLQVFQCGLFVEASGHRWQRSDLAEGILIYCVDGKGYFRDDDREYAVRSGELLYAAPNTHHSYWANDEEPWSIYWMHLAGPMLPHYECLAGLIELGPVRHIGVHPEIITEFGRLITRRPASGCDETQWLRAQTSATSILGQLADLPHNMEELATAYGPVQKAITLMNSSLDQPFDMERFAREAGLSQRHFSRQFRFVTGQTPGEWFIQQKIQHACTLLLMPGMRVKEVAARLSYADPLYFSRIFKRIAGMSPENYRIAQVGNVDVQGVR